MSGQLQEVEISRIDLDVSNHREVVTDQALLALAESIKVHGLMEPISVYRKVDGRFTLGFGHRRLEAHKLLALSTIPAIVHEAASESQIRAAQAVENLHRKDLTPLEEAQACQQLVQSLTEGADEPTDDILDQASAMVGRTRTWFTNRLALMRLSKDCQEALAKGEIYLGHAQHLAKLPDHEAQDEILSHIEPASFGRDKELPQPVYRCRDLVDMRLQDLTQVNWKLDVPFAGKIACSICPHNSANQPGLFDGDQPKKPMCLERACFTEKSIAASRAVIRASNTLAKMDKKTPANAEKAMLEREAAFVKTAPVVRRAKQCAAPATKKDGTTIQARVANEERSKKKAEIDHAWHEAEYEWNEQCEILAATEIRKSSARIAAYLLLQSCPGYRAASSHWGTDAARQKGATKIRPLLTQFKNVNADTLAQLAARIKLPSNNETWPLDNEGPVVLQMLAEVFGIGFPKKPVREDFVPKADAAKPVKKAKQK